MCLNINILSASAYSRRNKICLVTKEKFLAKQKEPLRVGRFKLDLIDPPERTFVM